MMEIIFIYEGQEISIQSNEEDKMKDIINRFKRKIKEEEEDNNLCYIYNGDIIINDKNENKINILVRNYTNEKEIILNQIICPECKENILIKINDYKITLYECKNGHKIEDIFLKEYENMQKIDITKVICNECYKNNRNINEELYVCNECRINLCPLCRLKHDSNHNIINYNYKYHTCKKHNDKYIKYCKECKENFCFICINEHKDHNILDLEDIIPNREELLEEMKYMREIINKFKNDIEQIKNILNKISYNVEIYYKIINNIVNKYNIKNRNYENYYNLNEIKNSNSNIINELKNINNENNINNRFKNMIEIYNKINRVTKRKIYENGDKYIGEFNNELKDGKGNLYYNKNDKKERNRYEGDWKDDKREGKGKLYWKDGDKYKGDFKDDKFEGKGI